MRVLLITLFSIWVLSQSALSCEIPSSKMRFLAPQDRVIDPKAFLGEHCVGDRCIEVSYTPDSGYLVKNDNLIIGRIRAKSTIKGHPLDISSSSLELDPPEPLTFQQKMPILALASKITGVSTDDLWVDFEETAQKWLTNLRNTNTSMNFDLVFFPAGGEVENRLRNFTDSEGGGCDKPIPLLMSTNKWLRINSVRMSNCSSFQLPWPGSCPHVIDWIFLIPFLLFLFFIFLLIFAYKITFQSKVNGPTQ